MKKILLLLTLFIACGKKLPPLKEGFASLDELAEYHLRCIETGDAECLEKRLLTFAEFRDSVYPVLPEAEQKTVSLEDYWGWTFPDRRKAVKNYVSGFTGKRLAKFRVADAKKVLRYGRLKIHRDVLVIADWQDKTTGELNTIATRNLLKAVVELEGQFKIWNLVYD